MQSSSALLIAELSQVHELARKLETHLDTQEIELCRTLAHEIVISIEKAICLAKAEQLLSDGRSQQLENLHQASDLKQRISKKRKTLPKWTSHVTVNSGMADGTPGDGCSWRKYGQKDILGAKHPRAYYRCTYRKSQGCPAMKQVQRSDMNPSVFEITYRGTHTCALQPHQAARLFNEPQQSFLNRSSTWEQLDSQSSLRVTTESSDSEIQDPNSSLFSFPSSHIEGIKGEKDLFCFSPAFMSPSTSAPDMGLEFFLEEIDLEMPFDTSIFFV